MGPTHVSLHINADGSAVPRALMRQEDQSALGAMSEVDSPEQDSIWARFFGTGSASVPDILAVPAETAAADLPQTVSEGSPEATVQPANSSSNATATTGAAESVTITTEDGKVIKTKTTITNTFSKVAAGIKHFATQDCKDTWEPEWSSEAAEENCQLWAANSDWGALAAAASVKIACEDEWAQAHCTATCGCEVVRAAQLDRAILKTVKGLGLSKKQVEEVSSTLKTITSSAKEAVLHVMGTAAVALNKTAAVSALAPATTTEPAGPASDEKSTASTSTTTQPAPAPSDIIAWSHALGVDEEQAKQLNATLQLIPKQHYDEILEVLKSIARAQPSTTTTTHVSVEDILQNFTDIGLKKEDVAIINRTLSDIKPNDKVLAAMEAGMNETKRLVKQIGVERTGKAIIRQLQNLSWPSREKLPVKDEPNDFVFLVAPSDARMLYRQRQGHDARGFYLKVTLPVDRLVAFIRERAQVDVDPRRLSVVISRFEFAWPSSSCSNEESGFTDFKLLDFHSGDIVNEGSDCGSLVASSMDQNGELRLPSDGSQELFWLAGMFGSKYVDSVDGAEVNLKISQLVLHEFRDSGDVIEYSICGRGSLTWKDRHFYLGCPKENPLEIVYSDNSLGNALKLCGGGIPSEDKMIQSNCFEV